MKKTFILDTNVLLSDCNALFSFKEHSIVLPFTVLEELDRHKDRQDEVGANARETSRKIGEMTKQSKDLYRGVPIGEVGGSLRILSIEQAANRNPVTNLPSELSTARSGDNEILKFCLNYQNNHSNESVIFVTRDLLLKIKAEALAIVTQDYLKFNVIKEVSGLYSGVATIPEQDVDAFYNDENFVLSEETEKNHNLKPNQFVILKGMDDNKKSAVARFIEPQKPLRTLPKAFNLGKLSPRNKEQEFAAELLLDPEIKLVTIVGKAGSGKTALSIAAGLEQIIGGKKRYKTMVICRPMIPLGKDIGYLPGPQPLDAKILTPAGWTTMGELKIGSEVIGRDGKTTRVTGIFPKGKKKVYKFFTTDGGSTECCDDHLWLTKTFEDRKNKKAGSVKTTRQLKQTLFAENRKFNHQIPRNQAVEFIEQNLPLSSYVLGIILGTESSPDNIFSTNLDSQIVERISRELSPIDCKLAWQTSIKDSLSKLNLLDINSTYRFIPNIYKINSIENRIALLQGLMDAGGKVQRNGKAVFCTASEKIALDVQELIRSLGGQAYLRSKNKSEKAGSAKSDNRLSHSLSVSLPKHIKPFFVTKKSEHYKYLPMHSPSVSSIKLVGEKEVQCIMVENPEHLYITDDYIVTHNTASEKLEPWIAPIKDNLRFLLSDNNSKKTKQTEETLKLLFENGTIEVEALTYLRGRSIANAFILIDEAQNANIHELKTILTRVGEGSKIVLVGDINQIDSPYLDSVSNGLSVAVEKFKDFAISGHVTLVKGERSALATLAASVL